MTTDGGGSTRSSRRGPLFAPPVALRWLADEPGTRHRRIDGALIWLDVSGFTAMSERLAGLGRIGAEEVSDVIRDTFTALLAEAAREQAMLLNFGGDAMLLMLAGDGVAERAPRLATDMRDVLRRRNPVRTAGGPVSLDATFGTMTGPIDMFLVGRRHRELMVLGPTMSGTVRAEESADPGQVVVADPGPLGGHPADPRLLTTPDRIDVELGSALLPDGLRGHLLQGIPPSQHRRATVAFVEFLGVDDLIEAEGAVAATAAVDDIVSVIQDACADTDVVFLASDVAIGGGRVLLMAGVIAARDDDDDRMLRCLHKIISAPTVLRVRAGVNRGPVYTGVVGPEIGQVFTAMGDAVNLAARTMSKAAFGTVLATVPVVNRARTLFETTPIEPFKAKGKAKAVEAVIVGAPRGVRTRDRGDDAPLVGRVAELATLLSQVDRVAAGPGQPGVIVELRGPPGIGKSRLVDEVHEARPELPVVLIGVDRFAADRPYDTAAGLLAIVLTGSRAAPPDDVFAAAEAVVADAPEESKWLPLLGDALGVDRPDSADTAALDPRFRPRLARDLVVRLLRLALPSPTLVVVEDIQWLDPETRTLLEELPHRGLASSPWAVLLTSRAAEPMGSATISLALDPLDDADVRAMVLGSIDRGEGSLSQLEPVVRLAAGNPLFVKELLRHGPDGELPEDIETLALQRLDALPTADQEVLSHAAVLGVEFPEELLVAVGRHSPGVDLSRLADLSGFIRRAPSGRLRFEQSLFADAAYQRLPFRRRRALHLAAAEAMSAEAMSAEGMSTKGTSAGAGPADVGALARHLHMGGDWAGTWTHARRAFDDAVTRHALASAVGLAGRALDAAAHLRVPRQERAALLEGLGDALATMGAFDDGVVRLRQARELAPPGDRGRIARKVGAVLERQGRYPASLRWYTIAEREADDVGERARSHAGRAEVRMRQGRPAEAMALAEQALEEIGGGDDPAGLAAAEFVLEWAASTVGDPRADAVRERAKRHYTKAGDLLGEGKMAISQGAADYFAGRWDAAATAYAEARERFTRAGDLGNAAIATMNLGEILGDQGRTDDAVLLLEDAERMLRAAQHVAAATFAAMTRGRSAARAGRDEAARALLRDAAATFDAIGSREFVHQAEGRLAEAALFAADAPSALAAAEAALKSADDTTSPALLALLHRVAGLATWLRDGGVAATATHLDDAARVAAGAGVGYEWALSELARATVGRDGADVDRARDVLRGLGVVAEPLALVLGPTWSDPRWRGPGGPAR